MLLQAIANSMKIPYLTIKWNTLEEENQALSNILDSLDNEVEPANQVLNIHPPAFKLMKSIIDLIGYYKWEYVTILYQESYGFHRIQNLIRLPRSFVEDNKFRLQVRQLSANVDEWIYLIKEIKLSGTSHIIVDIQSKYLNKFIKQVILSHFAYF